MRSGADPYSHDVFRERDRQRESQLGARDGRRPVAAGLVEAEVAKYLYADLWAGAGDAGEAKDGEKGGGGCCEIL